MKAKKSAGTRMSPEGPVRKGGTKPKPSTPKPDIKPAGQSPSKSVGQIAASRIGCPGVKMFRLSQLEPAGYNPRVITAEAMEGLMNSLSRFGCVEPIVVNTRGRKNVIVGGNQRFEALRILGITECLCVTVNCSRADEKLLNLSLNNPAIQGQFIKDIGEYIEKLRAELGDDKDYLALRIDQLRGEIEEPKEGLTPDDQVPEPPKKAKTKRGDLYILGNHRLLCGDATDEKDFKRLMGKQKADMVMADPPYNVGYTGGSSNKKERADSYCDKWTDEDYSKWLLKVLSCAQSESDDKAALHLWFAANKMRAIMDAFEGAGWQLRNLLIWNKLKAHYGALGAQYKERKEPMWYCHKKGKTPNWYGPTNECTVWDCEQPHSNDLHPTMKPVELYERGIKNHTKRNNIILEVFSGSGTTLIAAEKLGRRCFGLEIDPVYCDVIVKRWERWTGKKARLGSKRK